MSLIISALALLVSVIVAWLTLFRRGTLRMTRPNFIGFVWDTPGGEPKIYLRAMLYATGKRGHIIELLFLKVRVQDSEHIFSFWTVKQETTMRVGGGIKVDEDGVDADFHFLQPKGQHSFRFSPGEYDIRVLAKLVGRDSPIEVSKFALLLSEEDAAMMRPNMMNGVFFTAVPGESGYSSTIEGPRSFDS